MHMILNEDIDKKITDCLDNEVKDISAPENMFFKIKTEILKEKEGVSNNMKYKFLKPKIAVIAGLLCIATTITCAAATNSFSWFSTSPEANITNVFPATYKVKNAVGFLPKYAEKFQGGFIFKGFNASNNALKNGEGKTVLKTKGADFYYKKDGATKDQNLSLHATAINKDYFDNEIKTNKNKYINDNIIEYKSIKIYYEKIYRKIVPANYVKTDEDERLIKKGSLQIAYGSDSVTVNKYNSQSVIWYEGGIEYCIINSAYDDVNKTAMIEMAKTVINK